MVKGEYNLVGNMWKIVDQPSCFCQLSLEANKKHYKTCTQYPLNLDHDAVAEQSYNAQPEVKFDCPAQIVRKRR
jgi:hypothetical protein